MVRLKRVFRRIYEGAAGLVTMSDTPEMAHEVLWFLDRYPMDMAEDARVYLEGRRQEYLERRELIDGMLSETYEPREFTLALPPRHYQAVAADMLLRGGSLLVADDVGLGKTAIAIAAMTDPRTLPCLVVTLTHLPIQWTREVFKFAPNLRVHALKRGSPYPLPRFDVLISNYHKLGGWHDVLAGRIRMAVFDEAQELRTGPGTAKYDGAKHIAEKAAFRLALTATPIYNYGDEMFHVLNCLSTDHLGSREEFGREWCSAGSYGKGAKIANPRAFGKYLREEALVIRRTRAEVGRELPEVTRIPHYIDADLEVLDKVETTATELARTILSRALEQRKGEKMRAAEELSYLLRQATGLAKAPHVAAFVRLLVEQGEPVVLYGWHHAVYAVWRQALQDLRPAMYTGKEGPVEKEENRRRFLSGDTPVLIMSLRAGAGLDGLQDRCRTVVFGELDWSPGVHEQCVGRIHRDGQPDPVMAYFLVTDVGSDPVVSDVLGLKRAQSEGVRDPDAEMVERLQVDDQHIRKLAEAYLAQKSGLRVVPNQRALA